MQDRQQDPVPGRNHANVIDLLVWGLRTGLPAGLKVGKPYSIGIGLTAVDEL
ncbi:hypothetical protein ACLGIH_19560 [Streptomyces sp. HMX87]|uniref:hypothetical protein n=1 Tax=Streptomyces sp. HMX87 TaxID=3390849 RepID=UPI003A88DC27